MRTHITFIKLILSMLFFIGCFSLNAATRQMEYLDRGLVAVKVNNGIFLSWRYLGTDNSSVGFNIYRNGTKINNVPITTKTNYVDINGTTNATYIIKSVINGTETESSGSVTPWAQQYKTLTLKRPANNYTANDMSVGDVDGDGQYELFVKWDPNNSQDNSNGGYTDKVFIDCYRMDGTFLWRIDLGINIRAGAHYTQYQVFDYDGDGKCEIVCKTAPGTKDGKGKNVILNGDNPNADYRNSDGYILSGPEYLTIFEGATGAEIHTIAYNPARGNVSSWGDKYGNRVDRFLACTAYLDGVHPSVVMCRGYYTRSTLAAYDFKNGKLVQRWFHDSPNSGQGAYGEGFHGISVADVDNDGKDEIIYGSAIIDDNGNLYNRTGFGHGDALHISDLDPSRNGLEGWFVHEDGNAKYAQELRDLKTGQVIFGTSGTGKDNGRGLAADIDASHRGFECWSSRGAGVYNCKGNLISDKKPSINFRIYWDGDLQDELLDGTTCDKWTGNGTTTIMTFNGYSINGTKNVPNLSADLFGDWREEVIFQEGDKIYIYTTTIESNHRLFTPMHDAVYRCGVAWQNTSYNQPPHLSFYIGDGVDNIPQPDIYTPGHDVIPIEPTEPILNYWGELEQELMVGEQLTDITFSYGGTATSLEVSQLPNGLIHTTDGNTMTISGTPTEGGDFTISTKGGDQSKSITVKIVHVDDHLKRIAYITDPLSEDYPNDKILSMLKEQNDFYIREIDAQNTTTDFSLFDLIIISEITPSTAPVMNRLKGIEKPLLTMKVHAYKNAEGAWNWASSGYGDNNEATTLSINQEYLTHPMFKEINFTNGNEVQMVSMVDTKAITYMDPTVFSNPTGNITAIANIKGESNQISILEIAEGSSIANTKIIQKIIQIGLNSSSYEYITDDGLSIIKNACYYLLNMDITETNICETKNIESSFVYPNPIKNNYSLHIHSKANTEIYFYITDMDGCLIHTEKIRLKEGINRIERGRANIFNGTYILIIKDITRKTLYKTTLIFD